MDFVFQEFQSSLPLWIYLLLITGTTALAWWSYRSLSSASGLYRYTLITLRSLAFFILLFLLINPVFRAESTYYQKSNILVLLDDSESMSIVTDDYRGADSYQNALEELELDDSSRVSFSYLAIGENTRPVRLDGLTFGADRTNLNSAIGSILQHQLESNAAIILSDGIYTAGQNPVFDARKIDIPVFSVALGDTAPQRDLLVNSVSTNNTGYVNTEQQVSATVSARGFANQQVAVQIMKGDEVIDSETITPEGENTTTTVDFDLGLKTEGLQQYRVVIPHQTGEWTDSNNSQFFSIDVQDAKQRILSLAFEIHPDVRYIRSLLLSDANTNLMNRTWLKGNRFIEGDLDIDPDTVDLAVIHGFPGTGLSPDLEKTLSRLLDNIPVVITVLPLFNDQNLQSVVSSALPVEISASPRYERVTLSGSAEPGEHPVMELPPINYDLLSSLHAPIQGAESIPGARTLFTSEFEGQDTGTPLLSIMELGNRRKTYVSAYGWYLLGQSSNDQVRDFSEQLWFNIISWTAADPDNQRLSIEPSQRSYSGSEEVVISGFLKNESGEMEPEANIDIELSSDTMETKFYSMENRGNGQYHLDLGSMSEGIYAYQATARKGNRTIEQQTGEFAVAGSNIEFVNTVRNDQLLRQLSGQSNGHFFTYDSLNGFWDELQRRGLLEQQEKVNTTLFYPNQHWWWFAVVILLLSAEWVLRKYISLP